MVRFSAILVWCLTSSALASPHWNETLQELKSTATTGSRAQVAELLQSAYQKFESNEKVRAQILTWGAELLEIFNTQKGLNDFERAKTLSDLEPELALELLQRSLEAEPNHPKVLAQMVDIHLRRRDVGRAKALVQKLITSYPLWKRSYLYHLRVLSAEPGVRGLEELAVHKEVPFPDVTLLAALLHAAYGPAEGPETTEQLSHESLERGLQKFPEWPELAYLALRSRGQEKQKWATQFLRQCAEKESGAAVPKYPSAICQRASQVEELVEVNSEAL